MIEWDGDPPEKPDYFIWERKLTINDLCPNLYRRFQRLFDTAHPRTISRGEFRSQIMYTILGLTMPTSDFLKTFVKKLTEFIIFYDPLNLIKQFETSDVPVTNFYDPHRLQVDINDEMEKDRRLFILEIIIPETRILIDKYMELNGVSIPDGIIEDLLVSLKNYLFGVSDIALLYLTRHTALNPQSYQKYQGSFNDLYEFLMERNQKTHEIVKKSEEQIEKIKPLLQVFEEQNNIALRQIIIIVN